MKSIVKRHNTNKKKVNELITYVKTHGGMEYATEKMHFYKDKALAILATCADSQARQALEDLINFSIERKK